MDKPERTIVSGRDTEGTSSDIDHREGRFDGEGGIGIHWQAWQARGATRAPGASIVIAHGYAEHGGRYRQVAGLLAGEGCTVYAIDHRGHGRSAGPRGYIDRLDHAAAEVAAYAADPLNFHGKVPARIGGEALRFLADLPARLATVTVPVLALHGRADALAGCEGSELVIRSVGSQDKILRIYDGLLHEVFHELPADRARVFDDLLAWIRAHAGSAGTGRGRASGGVRTRCRGPGP